MATVVSVSSLPVGQTNSAGSTPVVLATDQSSIPVSDAKLPATLGQKVSSASLAVVVASDQSAVPTSNATQLPASLRTKTSAASLPVVLASDQASLPVASSPSATVGSGTLHHLISAATTNATSVKASPGSIGVLIVCNNASTKRYLKLYDKASAPTVGTDTPVLTLMLAPGETVQCNTGPYGIKLSAGIAYALVQNIAVSDTTAVALNDMSVMIAYT